MIFWLRRSEHSGFSGLKSHTAAFDAFQLYKKKQVGKPEARPITNLFRLQQITIKLLTKNRVTTLKMSARLQVKFKRKTLSYVDVRVTGSRENQS